MKWMMVVMLVAGLSGCNWLDETRISGAGAVIERQQPLGERVTRVLAGVPATLYLVAGEPRGILIKGQENLPPDIGAYEGGFDLLLVGVDTCEQEYAHYFGDRCPVDDGFKGRALDLDPVKVLLGLAVDTDFHGLSLPN